MGEEVKGYIGSVIDMSDRKQAEETLQESPIPIEAALAAGSIYTWCWNIVQDLVISDRNFAHLFGVDPEKVTTGLPLDQFLSAIHPEDRPQVTAGIERAIATGESYEAEYRVRDADGKQRWVMARGRVEYDVNGNAITCVGVLSDISDRKQAEETLRRSEERFRTLADNISQLAWMADENGWIFWYNQRWFDYTGTTFEQMQGWGWQDVHHPDYVEGVVKKFRHCIEIGETWEDTFPLRGKDGQYRWFLSRALPIRDETGNIACWFGTNTDITERKQTEEALHQRQQRLDIATSAAQLGVFEWDIQADYAIWENPQMYQIFGHTLEDETLNKAEFMESVIHPEDRETFEWALAEGIKGNNLFHLTCRIRRRNDGQWRWIELSGQLDVALDGTPLRLVGVVSDISDRKQFRQEDASITRNYGGLGLGLTIVRQLVEAHGGMITADSRMC